MRTRVSREPLLAGEVRGQDESGRERTQESEGHSLALAGDLLPFVFAPSSHIALMPDLSGGGLSCPPAWTAAGLNRV